MQTNHEIPLNRRFRRATEDDERPFRGLFGGGFNLYPTWPDLLGMRRVVILAEAGSGKSTEFKTQCAALKAAGKFAFSASVRDVAQAGLATALVPAERARLATWQADEGAECWLFVDSVDEAREQGLHFDTAARMLADEIAGYEERTHIYISGRFTDWDATADRVSMEKWLAMPEPPPPLAPDFETEVRNTLHNKERSAPVDPKDPIAVLVLEPLERAQVRRFAEGSGITDVDAFLAAVDHGNLWSFAARPLDLGWMVDYWRAHARLGTLRQMIEVSSKRAPARSGSDATAPRPDRREERRPRPGSDRRELPFLREGFAEDFNERPRSRPSRKCDAARGHPAGLGGRQPAVAARPPGLRSGDARARAAAQ